MLVGWLYENTRLTVYISRPIYECHFNSSCTIYGAYPLLNCLLSRNGLYVLLRTCGMFHSYMQWWKLTGNCLLCWSTDESLLRGMIL